MGKNPLKPSGRAVVCLALDFAGLSGFLLAVRARDGAGNASVASRSIIVSSVAAG